MTMTVMTMTIMTMTMTEFHEHDSNCHDVAVIMNESMTMSEL